jgi:hypothetical protein
MQIKDRTGQRFGKLVAISYEQRVVKSGQQWVKRIIWMCRCDCGNTREVSSHRLSERPPLSCVECAAQSNREKATVRQRQGERAPLPKHETSLYMRDYERYRKSFTPEQRARYEEVLRGRRGVTLEREAVDVVMREPEPGICCERCLKNEPMPLDAIEEEDQQPDALKKV